MGWSFGSHTGPAVRAARVALAVLAAFLVRVAMAGSPPPWFQAQVSAPIPDHDDKTASVLLYSESVLKVESNGQLRHLYRRVYRILRTEGEDRAIVRVDFDDQTRINTLRAWSIPKEGKPYDVGMHESLETSLTGVQNGELVSDIRSRILHIPAAMPGSLVGYETEVQERPNQLVDEWLFEQTEPVRETHYSLELPPGWSYKATWLNHPEEAPSTSREGHTEWILRDLKEIRPEDNMPPWRGIAGRLVISLIPPNGQPKGFQNWNELGVWYQGLLRGRTDSSPQIKQTVADLTRSAASPLDRIRALAAFTQNEIRYVAIELGIGGLQPHAATDVLAHRYGDCKDKATLLNTLLREIGIESQYFIINTVRGSITDSTPANLGFNHAILAIRLPPDLADPSLLAVTTHPKLGRLLFFDPTDPLTPLGGLSGELQSNYGLLVTPEGGELIRTPQLASSVNGIRRSAKLTLDEKGTLQGDVEEIWSGDRAAGQRAALRAATRDTDVIKPVERVAAASFSDFGILKAAMANARIIDKPFEWRYTVEARAYAKTAGDLLLVRPRVIGTKSSGLLETTDPRRYTIEFEGPERDTDVFEIALPAGYEVDELPPPVNVDYGFISYQSKTEAVGHNLRYTRTFERKELSVPVAKAEDLKKFFRIVADDERNSAVLKPVASRH